MILRAAAAAMLAALMAAAWSALFYAWHPALLLQFDRALPRNMSGVYPVERDEASALTFAWTGQEAVLRVRRRERGATWTQAARARVGGPADDTPDDASGVGGGRLSTLTALPEWSDQRLTHPERAEERG